MVCVALTISADFAAHSSHLFSNKNGGGPHRGYHFQTGKNMSYLHPFLKFTRYCLRDRCMSVCDTEPCDTEPV